MTQFVGTEYHLMVAPFVHGGEPWYVRGVGGTDGALWRQGMDHDPVTETTTGDIMPTRGSGGANEGGMNQRF